MHYYKNNLIRSTVTFVYFGLPYTKNERNCISTSEWERTFKNPSTYISLMGGEQHPLSLSLSLSINKSFIMNKKKHHLDYLATKYRTLLGGRYYYDEKLDATLHTNSIGKYDDV